MVINMLATYSCWQVDEKIGFFHLCNLFCRLLAPRGRKSLNFNIPGSNIYQDWLKYNIIWFWGCFLGWPGNHLEITWKFKKCIHNYNLNHSLTDSCHSLNGECQTMPTNAKNTLTISNFEWIQGAFLENAKYEWKP